MTTRSITGAAESTSENSEPDAAGTSGLQTVHLKYLDGIRGLSALYVVLHHSVLYTKWGYSAPLPLWHWLLWKLCSMGHYAVVVFIVLSGYCLMLPIAREGAFKKGLVNYFKRRAWRMLPPYYAALACTWILIALLRNQGIANPAVHWSDWLPAFTPGVVISHLGVFHNLSPDWWDKIDGPTWTIATEWQLYFVLPLLVIIWRKAGIWAMVTSGILLGIVAKTVFPSLNTVHFAFLGCFAAGAGAAAFNFTRGVSLPKRHRVVTLALSPVAFLTAAGALSFLSRREYVADTLVGVTVACVLGGLTHWLQQRNRDEGHAFKPILLRLFEARISIQLGAISYSLYLIHGPILNTLQLFAHNNHLNLLQTQVCLLLGGGSLALLVASQFYRWVEEPSKNRRV